MRKQREREEEIARQVRRDYREEVALVWDEEFQEESSEDSNDSDDSDGLELDLNI